LADEISVIDEGRVIAHDTPDGLKQVVGGQRLTVAPTDPARLADVATILAGVAGEATPERGGHGTHPWLRVPVEGEHALAVLAPRLVAAGIAVTELSLHLPSLDEVFFTLTGHTATEEEVTA
jgi:oleandomycin transport system ATP-binding protein